MLVNKFFTGFVEVIESAKEASNAMQPKKITVEPSADHPEILDIRDAMRQVMDYFDLFTDQGNSNVVWNLVFASTNSPFTAKGSPVDLRTNAPAFAQVKDHVAVIERGLARVQAGEPLDEDFPMEKKSAVMRILERNTNGIEKTRIEFDDGNGFEIVPQVAERFLAVMQGAGDEEYDYLFATFARNEVGSIEGRIVDLGTDYDEHSIKLKEHRTGREILCQISPEARDEIENSLTVRDVWTHRRIRIRGVINYDANGKIIRVFNGIIVYIDTKEVSTRDLRDPEFTGGLPTCEYLDKLRENELG